MSRSNALGACFSHEAMATTFRVTIAAQEARYAQQAALAVFAEVDRLEGELSRFVDSSDISYVNALETGESCVVSPDTFRVLEIARDMYERTNGKFDVTIGSLVRCWVSSTGEPCVPDEDSLEHARAVSGFDLLELSEDDLRVKVLCAGVQIDLGGIGKGFALDVAALTLLEWGIDSAFLDSGTSTVLALDAAPDSDGWPVGLDGDRILVKNSALSGSGLAVRGEHIIDPSTGTPITGRTGAWALCPTAAVADALSTAFMLLSPEDVQNMCESVQLSAGRIVERDDVRNYGLWA